jgi:hypothetical protein
MAKRPYKYRIPAWLIEFIVAVALVFGIIVIMRSIAARAEPADQWIEIVIEADLHADLLDHEDQRFVRFMANVLTATPNVTPTAPQRQWLLAIKNRIERRGMR